MKLTPESQPGAADSQIGSTAPENTAVSYEEKDVNVSGVERAGLILAITVLVTLAVVGGAFHFLTAEQPSGTPDIAAGMRPAGHELPPAPRLQEIPGDSTSPPEQQREFQGAAAAQLNSYGWNDDQHTTAHIPIDEAMKILATQGLAEAAAQPKGAPARAGGKTQP